jgi:hypothetical protein
VPLAVVKCVYDYEASAENEMAVSEDEILYSYVTDEGWILAKSRDRGTIGYVPGNYVEEVRSSTLPLSLSNTCYQHSESTADSTDAHEAAEVSLCLPFPTIITREIGA